MENVKDKIDKILQSKGLTRYKVCKLIDCKEGTLNQMVRGERPFSDNIKEKLIPILEVSLDEFEGWILADKYPKEVLERALQLKQEYANCDKPVITTKINELLQDRNLTITPFAREIGYNQGWLSQVVAGNEPVSKKLMQKLCDFFGLSPDEITSWLVADKYSADALRVAIK